MIIGLVFSLTLIWNLNRIWLGLFGMYSVIHPFLVCLMFVTWRLGPFKINGVPLRRVNQSYVIATSTKVDVSAVNVDKFDEKYFSKESQKKKKKGEGEFFEAEKEVGLQVFLFCCFLCSSHLLLCIDLYIFYTNAGKECVAPAEERWPENCGLCIDKRHRECAGLENLSGCQVFLKGWCETPWASLLDEMGCYSSIS